MLRFKTLKRYDFLLEEEGKKVLISDSISILKIILSDESFIHLKFFVNTSEYVLYNHIQGRFEIKNKITLVAIIASALSAINISYNTAKLQNVVDQLLVTSHAKITPLEKYFNKRFISFKNGVLDLNSFRLLKHDPKCATLDFINLTYKFESSPEFFFNFLINQSFVPIYSELTDEELLILASLRERVIQKFKKNGKKNPFS